MAKTGNVYVHMGTRTVVRVTNDPEGSPKATIVTVTPMGDQVRKRSIAHTRLNDYLRPNGVPRKTGYIDITTLPDGHLLKALPAVRHAVNPTEPQASYISPYGTVQAVAIRAEDVNLQDLDHDALVRYLGRLNQEFADAKQRFDDAKDEAKRRAKSGGGLVILDGMAVEMYPTRRVDDGMAQKNLTAQEYEDVCVPKIDATRARERLPEDRLKLALKDNGWTLKVRHATAEDREKAANSMTDAFGRRVGAADNVIPMRYVA